MGVAGKTLSKPLLLPFPQAFPTQRQISLTSKHKIIIFSPSTNSFFPLFTPLPPHHHPPMQQVGASSCSFLPHSLSIPTATSTESSVGLSSSRVRISRTMISCACVVMRQSASQLLGLLGSWKVIILTLSSSL